MGYSENDIGRITGVILESFEFNKLKKMIENEDKTELKKVINEAYEVLKEYKDEQSKQ